MHTRKEALVTSPETHRVGIGGRAPAQQRPSLPVPRLATRAGPRLDTVTKNTTKRGQGLSYILHLEHRQPMCAKVQFDKILANILIVRTWIVSAVS